MSETSRFAKDEEQVLEFWQKNKTFEKSVDKESPQGSYIFYDGPPFITGLPHYASLLPSIAKDVVPRYWTMKGYRVERVWGWDCHGLPAENKVEEELKLKNKKDIENLGVDKFVNACRTYVDNVSGQWEWYINRIGRWVDMKNAYRTMDLTFMESVIWAFKQLYDKDLIYEGYRSSLHCPRCATPLSKFEVTMDAGNYQDVEDTSVVVKFKLKDFDNKYILAWTTTPWTLPGNLALAVGKNIDYIEVKIKDDIYILAKDRVADILKDYKFNIIERLQGQDLIGLEYQPVFDLNNKEIKKDDKVYKIYEADFVTTEDGTGVVHIAPNFGEEDFELGKEIGLPMVDIMDENGIYEDSAGSWAGLYFKDAGEKVLKELKDSLFSKFDYIHSYPFCHRCQTPLIYKTQKAWYLKIDQLRDKLIKSNQEINWVPEYFKEGRFLNNLETAPDWCLSRSRYWGSPIPVWRCSSCEQLKVVGSIEELEQLSGQKVKDLHRPDIDEIKFECKCGQQMERVPEVLDCWFESGAMSFAQWHYPFERQKEFNNIFPADFIIEYTGQLRGWFYYLHVLSNALFDSISFKNVIVTGVLAGTDGRKMSKSYGNYPDPEETLNQFGSDALRMYFMSSPIMVGDDMSMSERDLQDSLRKNVMLLENVYKFFETYNQDKIEEPSVPKSNDLLDQWILAKLNQFNKDMTDNLENYNLPKGARSITEFIDQLSTWFLRRSRARFKSTDQQEKDIAIQVTGYVLHQTIKILAPFMPFIAERLWQKLTAHNFQSADKSVHLTSWPEPVLEQIDTKLLEKMETTRKIIEQALSVRAENGLKIRQPLQTLYITKKSLDEGFYYLIKDEVNVKQIEIAEKLPVGSNFKVGADENYKVALDIELNEDLILEGHSRELIRQINSQRKNLGLSVGDLVDVEYQTQSTEIKKALEKFGQEIKQNTLTKELVEGKADQEYKINNEVIYLKINK